MQRTVKIISVLAAMALAAACGSGPSPSSPTSPSLELDMAGMPPKAEIDVTLGLDALYGPSADPGYAVYLRFTTAMSESAGLGAHLNYVRGDFFQNDVLVERYEFGAAQIVEDTGSNRLEAGDSRSIVVMLRFSAPADLIRATFQFTDDQGHQHHLAGTIIPSSAAITAALAGESGAPRL